MSQTPDSLPLLVTADELLLADVQRLAAAGGVGLHAAADGAGGLREWSAAPLVLVGADRAEPLARCHPPRRGRVHVVSRGPVPDEVFRWAVQLGAESVTELPTSDSWLVEMFTDVGDGGRAPGRVVGVIGGAGGVGASVFAAGLALHLSGQGPTLLVDADPWGAGADKLLGWERTAGVRWDAMMLPTGRLSARSLRASLPQRGDLAVLTWPARGRDELPAFAVREVLSAGKRGFGTVVVDLPRRPDPVFEAVVARCEDLLLVTTLTVPAVSSAARVAPRVAGGPALRHLVTRQTRAGIEPEEASRVIGIPLMAAMSDQRGLDEAISLGAGPLAARRGPLARAVRTCVSGFSATSAAA